MMFSTKGRYALRVMTDLAEHNSGALIPLKEISDRQGVSLKYLESIMVVLAKAGYVVSQHGKGGGYRLARAPETYTVSSILELTDGSLAPISCMENDSLPCPRASECRTLPMWSELYALVRNYLDGKTLADLAKSKTVL